MRKIKITLQHRVPSWNFCNYDGGAVDLGFSKELCRFCQKTKGGYRCLLYEASLKSDETFVYKPQSCIDATAGFAITADEPVPTSTTNAPAQLVVEPKTIIKETIKEYNKLVQQLEAQGYPHNLAVTIATQHMTGGSK